MTVEQVKHFLTGADAHAGTFNKPLQDHQVGMALAYALLLISQELDQIGDCLAVIAGLKDKSEASIT